MRVLKFIKNIAQKIVKNMFPGALGFLRESGHDSKRVPGFVQFIGEERRRDDFLVN